MKPLLSIAGGVVTALFMLTGCAAGPRPGTGAEAVPLLRINLAYEGPTPNTQVMEAAVSGDRYYIAEESIVSDDDIESARISRTAAGLRVNVRLTDGAASRLHEVTSARIGERLGVLVGSTLLRAPIIGSAVGSSSLLQIDLPLSDDEAVSVAAAMETRFDALP